MCEDTVCLLLSAGVMFQMPHIINSCCTFLERQLDSSKSCIEPVILYSSDTVLSVLRVFVMVFLKQLSVS